MTVFFFTCLLSYFLLTGFAGFKAYQHQQLHLIDTLLPIWVIGCWSLLAAFGVGQQSLGNLIELPLLLFIASVLYNARVYLAISNSNKTILTRRSIYIIVLVITITIRLSSPLMME
ncbi:hypothetical protein [Vibrio methylphosphonaticus]|uniref:hypothetical protein n=1 Tax=Vibrio methylphosphonaticus TaxID=2946866 RepID=UPI00202A097B|nr:hypothetical protein [Vibrio methylphosphonaticus]MCL9773679.1 hypothetical protein [Vibrio methylphosphonaticus]